MNGRAYRVLMLRAKGREGEDDLLSVSILHVQYAPVEGGVIEVEVLPRVRPEVVRRAEGVLLVQVQAEGRHLERKKK